MKIPLWKRILSHFKQIRLEHTGSVYNPYLEVLLVEGRKQLNTREAIYSFDDKYDNFRLAFGQINWNKLKGKSVLVLGLGLGSVILLLEKNFGKKLEYTAVEIDPVICQLAQKYNLSNLDSYIEVNALDAEKFLAIREEKYDMILMDIFQSAEIPQRFQSVEFLDTLKDHLTPEGLLLYNRMNITDKDKEENTLFDFNFKAVFPDYKPLEIKQNFIYINNIKYLA